MLNLSPISKIWDKFAGKIGRVRVVDLVDAAEGPALVLVRVGGSARAVLGSARAIVSLAYPRGR